MAKSPTAQRMLKYSFNLIDDGLVGQQLFAGETTRLAYMAEEAVEGRDAFLEKRDPDFTASPGMSDGFGAESPGSEEDAVIVEVMGAEERPEARVVDVDDLAGCTWRWGGHRRGGRGGAGALRAGPLQDADTASRRRGAAGRRRARATPPTGRAWDAMVAAAGPASDDGASSGA